MSKFSLSMCVYKRDDPLFFDAALNSVIHQTLKPSEVVLSVDGPITKEIQTVIDKHQRLFMNAGINFKIIYLKKNVGHGEARRVSFNNCSYPRIALMDADDICVVDRFEKQIVYLNNHPEVSAVGGYIEEFISSSDPTDVRKTVGRRIVPEKDEDIKEYMKRRCPMNQVTVMFRKDDVAKVGGYIDWFCEEDYYLWIRLALAGKKFGNIPDKLVNVRVGEEMYQRRGGYKYFFSEAKLQRYMLSKKMITFPRYVINISERLVLQVLMPNRIRGWVFRKFARE